MSNVHTVEFSPVGVGTCKGKSSTKTGFHTLAPLSRGIPGQAAPDTRVNPQAQAATSGAVRSRSMHNTMLHALNCHEKLVLWHMHCSSTASTTKRGVALLDASLNAHHFIWCAWQQLLLGTCSCTCVPPTFHRR